MAEIRHLNQLASEIARADDSPQPMQIWVPSAAVDCFSVPAVTAPKKKWGDIIPWQLEDALLTHPNEYHFAWHSENDQQPLAVFAIKKVDISQWQLMAKAQGIHVVAMVPDFFALPVNTAGWTAFVDGNTVIVRTATAQGFSCEQDFFWQLLQRQRESEENFTLWLWSDSVISLPETLQNETFIEQQQRQLHWDSIEFPSQYSVMRGEFAAKPMQSSWMQWRTPMALTTVTLALLCCWLWLAGDRYQADAAILQQAVSKDYQALFNTPPANALLAQKSGEQELERMHLQARLFQHSQFSVLRDLDAVFSRCTACQIKSLTLADEELLLVISGPDNMQSYFAQMKANYEMAWQSAGQDAIVTLKVKQGGAP